MRVLRWLSNIWMSILILNLVLAVVLIGGRFVLPYTAPATTLRITDPADGMSNVAVRSRPTLTFAGPMNPRSVEAALQIEPETPAILIWDPNFTTLIISPTLSLRPSTEYHIRLQDSALSQRLSPLATPAVITFRTVAAPAVRSTSPAAGSTNIAPITPIVVNFSRTMVSPEVLLRPTQIPELYFDPPIRGRALWVDQSTLLFRVDTPLTPGQEYQATLDANLTDLEGGPLGQPFNWSFRIAPPQISATIPRNSDRAVALRTPLSITLTQALPTAQLQQALMITPTTSGQLTSAILPDLTQVITFTPTLGWQPGTEYQATLQFSDRAQTTLRFNTAPRLALSGRFPGEGQILPSKQQIRLVFSTPVDPELLRSTLRFDPPATSVQVTGSGSELRIAADLRAATAYTMTIPPDLTARNGDMLGIATTIRFATAPALPALSLPEMGGHLAQFLVDHPIDLLVRRTNTSALQLDLFDMDEATVVRTRIFSENDWQNFDPERYQRPRRRSWTIPLNDTLNAAVEDRLAITTESGAALAPGTYYLRIRTPEGPRADLIFSVTRTQLVLQIGEAGGLIWATDAFSGTILPSIPLALYQDDALILEGNTDQNGLLRFSLAGGQIHTYTALMRSPDGAIVTAGPRTLPLPNQRNNYRLTLITAGSSYQSGMILPIAGFVREVVTNTLTLPSASGNVQIKLRDQGGRVYATTQALIDPRGFYSAALELRSDLAPGPYSLIASLGVAQYELPIQIAPASSNQNRLRIQVNRSTADVPREAVVLAETTRGIPLASAPISWTLSASFATPPLPPGFRSGISGIAQPAPISETAVANNVGQLTLPISTTISPAHLPLRYHLSVQSTSATASAAFTIDPTSRYIGIRTAAQIALEGNALAVDLLVVDPTGKPIAGQVMQLQLFNASQLNERPVVTRRVVSGRDGIAQIDIDPPGSGAFVLRATTRDPQQRETASEVSIWAAGRPTIIPTTPQLIADQSSYIPGATVTLLPVIPDPIPAALLLITHGATIDPSIRTIQPGQPFTLTLASDTLESTQITLIAPALAGSPPLAVSSILPLTDPTTIANIQIASDRASYAPNATALLTTTVTTSDGNPMPADLIVALVADDPAPSSAPPSRATPAVFWSGPLRATNGTLTLGVPLPPIAGQFHAIAWVASAQSVTQSSIDLSVVQPLAVYLDPPMFLRPGDQVGLPARIVSHSPLTQTVALTLQSDQFKPVGAASFSQTIALAPYATARVVWAGSTDGSAELRVTMTALSGPDGASDSTNIPILIESRSVAEGAALVTNSFQALIPSSPQGQLIIDLAGSPDAIALNAAHTIAALPTRSTLDTAALLLISAPLTVTQELANAQITQLATAQNPDGGWGWWPQLHSDPQTTAIVLEALAAADSARLRIPDRTRSAGLAWAERNLGAPLVTAARVQLAYALALHGRAPTSVLAKLSAQIDTLPAHETALLLLALPAEQDQARAAATQRLIGLADRASGQAHWMNTEQPEDMVVVSSLALQGLAPVQGNLRRTALATLASWRTPDGWGAPYTTARALVALQAIWPRTQSALQYTLDLNSERLLAQAGGAITATQRLTIPASRLSSTNTLTVTTTGDPLMLSYQLVSPAPPPPRSSAVLILREVFDTNTRQALAPEVLLPHQPTTVQLTLIVQRQLRYTQIEVPLPPGVNLQRFSNSSLWPFVGRCVDRLIFAQDTIAPGVYEIRYQLQPGLQGQFSVPQPVVRDLQGRIVSVVQDIPTAAGSTVEPMREAMPARHSPERGAMDVLFAIGKQPSHLYVVAARGLLPISGSTVNAQRPSGRTP